MLTPEEVMDSTVSVEPNTIEVQTTDRPEEVQVERPDPFASLPPGAEFAAVGRRKRAVARVRLRAGSGSVIVNGRAFENYFPVEAHRFHAIYPLIVTNLRQRFDVRVNVCGGGIVGQAGAIRHGIARALLQFDPTLRPLLKREGLLTRDPREKERKKAGQPGARKRFQFSKR